LLEKLFAGGAQIIQPVLAELSALTRKYAATLGQA
jgi:hypothetical protein